MELQEIQPDNSKQPSKSKTQTPANKPELA
jgi:hypothetical protein